MSKLTYIDRYSKEEITIDVNECPFCGKEMVKANQDVVCPTCHIGTRGFGFISMAAYMWNIHTTNLAEGKTLYKHV